MLHTPIKKINVLFYFFLAFPGICFSQKVNVSSITETRSTENSIFGNRCEITLLVKGDEVRKYKQAKVTKITKAIDDQGLDLISEETSKTKYTDIEGTNASVSVTCMPTSRKAEVIKELSGEVSLFSPTEANGGIIKVRTFGKSTNKNLTPNVKGLSLVYLTKESIQKMEEEQKSKVEAELKKQPAEIQELAKELSNLNDAFSYMGNTGEEVSFFVTGDEEKLIDVFFENSSGTKLANNGWFSSGGMKTYYFSEEIKPAYTLVLEVEAPGAIKKIPFMLKDIDLP